MAKESKTGSCRFCGQNIMIEDGADMTEPQRVNELFGEEAGDMKQPEVVQTIITQAVDAICDKKMKSATVTIRTGLKCRIMQIVKDKIKVVRELSDNDEFVQ